MGDSAPIYVELDWVVGVGTHSISATVQSRVEKMGGGEAGRRFLTLRYCALLRSELLDALPACQPLRRSPDRVIGCRLTEGPGNRE